MKEIGRTKFIIILSFITMLASCNIFKKQPTHYDSNEPYQYVNTVFPSGDTIYIATLRDDMFDGPIKVKKQKGNYYGGMDDKIYNDAFSYSGWTYGEYRKNKKYGEWYYLNNDSIKTLSVSYKNDTLDGQYLRLLENGIDTLISCNYKSGILHGKYIFNEGNGIINGVSLYGAHRWELNYFCGKLDGLQKKYYEGELKEQIIFDKGQIKEIIFSDNIIEHKISDNGDGYIILENASFAFGILGRQFCQIHNQRIDLELFSDDIYSGKIELCRGYFCPGEFEMYSEILKSHKQFKIYYDIKIERKN